MEAQRILARTEDIVENLTAAIKAHSIVNEQFGISEAEAVTDLEEKYDNLMIKYRQALEELKKNKRKVDLFENEFFLKKIVGTSEEDKKRFSCSVAKRGPSEISGRIRDNRVRFNWLPVFLSSAPKPLGRCSNASKQSDTVRSSTA